MRSNGTNTDKRTDMQNAHSRAIRLLCEDKMAAQQLQKAERSTRINREAAVLGSAAQSSEEPANALQYVGVFFTYWSLLTSGALCNRAKEEAVLQLSAKTS